MFKATRRAYGAGYRAGRVNGFKTPNPFATRRGLLNKWLSLTWEQAQKDGVQDRVRKWLQS